MPTLKAYIRNYKFNPVTTCIYMLASISMYATTAIGPAMGGVSEFFNGYPTLAKFIFSLPALFVLPATLLTPYICTFIPKKKILIYSLVVYTIAGSIAGFFSNIYAILVCRAFLGISVGFLMPLSQSLPIDFYTGIERIKVVTKRNASQNLGSLFCLLSSGVLATFSWRYSFATYLVGLPVLFLILFKMPDVPTADKEEDNKSASLFTLPSVVYFYFLYVLVFTTIIYAFYGNIAILINVENIGSSMTSGNVLAAAAFAAFIISYNLERIRKFCKHYTEALGWLCLGISYVLFATSTILPLFYLGGMLASTSLGILLSTILINVSTCVEKEQGVQAMSLMTIALFLGQFLSPLLFDNVPLLPNTSGIKAIYLTLAMPSLGICLTTLGISLYKRNKTK